MPLTTLIPVGTVAETSAETTLSDGVIATLVLVGSGLVSIEVKTAGAQFINVGELTTKTPVQKIQGPMTFRVRRGLVPPTWAPSGLPEVTEPVGVDLYSGFTSVQSVIATARVCLGTSRATVTTSSQTLASVISGQIPVGAVTCEIQPDGGTIRIRRDGQNPTTTLGLRVDDGIEKMIDTPLADVRLISGGASSVPANVIFFDRV